ncbi:MAG: Gfo/Idh/MocA family oxidoreductase [Acidobacteria bacterium]|nr:Gfo/Idh/MocA family oxidoreductase [Acidobacteriota bacterium]
MSQHDDKLSRRELLKSATIAGTALTLNTRLAKAEELLAEPPAPSGASMMNVKFEKLNTVRLGIIGVGGRGLGMLSEWMAVEGLEVTAICDIDKGQIDKTLKRIEKAGKKAPAVYSKNERDFENLCKRDDVDFIYIATPWDWHVPMAVAAMNNGKHCGLEVPAATTVEGCWELVNTSEKTRRHCMIMENCCYGWSEMLVLNAVKAGLLGSLLHGECAYNHDLRAILNENRSEGIWRRIPHTKKNGNFYPTHGLGPVSNYMGINRGDKYEYLVSMSSPALGLNEYREKKVPKDDPKWKEKYLCGDMNTSLIKTNKGRTIMLQHNITTPRPYDRINLIQGTKGLFRDYPDRIFVEEEGSKEEEFVSLKKYQTKYEHELWQAAGELARKNGGHGGMDYIMVYRVVQCLREGLAPDMDVYDAAAWSVPGPLSELSVAKGSTPVKFPDFTRGKWQDTRNVMA